MNKPVDFKKLGCRECLNGEALGFDFSMAFQPIVNVNDKTVFAYEALARGVNGEPFPEVYKHVNDKNLYRFDQTCRAKSIELASKLHVDSFLSINFLPNSVYKPELCIRTTLAAAENFNFPTSNIIFEITESEKVNDAAHLKRIVSYYRQCGFKTAIDDFGAGYAGLNLLSDIQTDIIKLDMKLIRSIDTNRVNRTIVKHVIQMCQDLSITVIAEGAETKNEVVALQDLGINLIQGYYFSKPLFEAVSAVDPIKFELG